MAETNKTEQPTARRLEKAQEKGQVAHSQELVSAISLAALVAVTALVGPWFTTWCKNQILSGLSCDTSLLDNSQSFIAYMNGRITDSILVMTPFLLALMIAGIAGSLAVSGWHFSMKAAELKLEQLNPVNGMKNLFSPESVVRLLLSIVKLVFIGVIVWFYLADKIPVLSRLQWADTNQLLPTMGSIILGAVLRIILGLLVIGAADMFYQKWKYIDRLKMTKQEVREEHRDTDGAPEVKSKIRRKQYETAMRRMLHDVPKANVVLVNPTHVAVAVQYDAATMAAPIVLAKGGDHLCEKIKEIARAHGIPIIRRPALARDLFADVKLGHPIPEKLFTAVAEVLALLYRLRRRG
ncbi:MAG: flagellar biosynthesis protein FlhB [Planctomycetaceae bacterium]|nr:flagellar biosynthesis protein FlhB [Planctomycetaceae bacterium]